MSRVLFIYPNINTQEGFNHGVAALSGALRAVGADTKLLNLSDSLYDLPDTESILDVVRDYDPDLICFSVMTQQYKYAVEIARAIKERFAFPLAIGGVHCAMVPHEVAREQIFDYIGIGECDIALPRLLEAIKAEGDVTAIDNIWALRDGDYVRNGVGDFPDLDELPPKDFEIFDLDHMLSRMNGWMSLLSSRGCPFACSYCFNHKIMERYRSEAGAKASSYLRRYPLERVLSEARSLKERHRGIETFIFDDDLFTLGEKEVIDFCEGYQELGLGVPFVVNAHVQSFTRPMAAALKDAGCLIVKFGLESGSERIRRDVLNRRMTNDQIVRAFSAAHEAGLHTSAFLMLGLPLETRDDMEATIDLVARIEPGRFRWSVFYPFPGTAIHDLCVKRKLIDRRRVDGTETFYEGTCLRFEPESALLVEKLQRCFHWYVNARTAFGAREVYAGLVDEIENLSAGEWAARSEGFLDEDRALSARLNEAGSLHYSIRYTQVMAVRSDFEEQNRGFTSPAKEWGRTVRERTQ